MKYSLFNSLLPYKDKYVLYNSLSQVSILLETRLAELIKSTQNDFSSLRSQHPQLFDVLIKKRFMIDDCTDEISIMRNKMTRIDSNPEKYTLMINPTMNCNFKCWYCYEDHIRGSKISEENMEKMKKCISNIIQNNNLTFFSLSFFGGEPLLYFRQICYPLIEIWSQLTDNRGIEKNLSFTTNGYLVDDKLISYLQKHVSYTHFYITLDGSKEDHNKVRYVSNSKGSYDKIVENITKLTNAGFKVTLRINYTQEKLANCHKILEDLKSIESVNKKHIIISLHCVWQDSHNMKGKQSELFEQLTLFSDAGFTVNSSFSLRTVEQMCYGDKWNTALINYNGDVFKCSARKFDTKLREGYLNEDGIIIWDSDKINRRMDSKLTNKPCLTCRILPHCWGGCTQHLKDALLLGKEYCVHNFDEKKIDSLILDHVERLLALNRSKAAKPTYSL